MSKSGTIIIVDDNKGVLTAVQILLKSYFSKIVTLSSPVTLSSVIREETPEVILLDRISHQASTPVMRVYSGCMK